MKVYRQLSCYIIKKFSSENEQNLCIERQIYVGTYSIHHSSIKIRELPLYNTAAAVEVVV